MNWKAIFSFGGRVLLSGILAGVILTGFCYFYYNMPVRIADADGATDYRWEPNTFYCRGTEGFAWGRTNNEGYLNPTDFLPESGTDILVMGSSQMEGYQVEQKESAASRLDALLPEDRVYNIGVSGHTFPICVSNLEAAIKKYQPAKYVVMETDRIRFSDEELIQVLEGTVAEIASYSGGIVGLLQKNPYLRLAYSQMQSFAERTGDGVAEENVAVASGQTTSDEGLLSAFFEKIETIARAGQVRVIVLYHPGITVREDATIQLNRDLEAVQQFRRLCTEHGITLLDMSERFVQEYEASRILPYGFTNSSVGNGHLNKYGHGMIADELYQRIKEGA